VATVEIGAGGTSGAVGALVPIVAGELGCTVVVVLVVVGAAVVVVVAVVEVVAGTVTAGIVDEFVDVVEASGVATVRSLDEELLGTESFDAMRSLFVAQLVAKNASRIILPMRRPFACLTAARSAAALDAIINVAGPSEPHALEALPKP
jgi:hypothetical protein